MNSVDDLDVFKLAHSLALQVYSLTKTFPKEEHQRKVQTAKNPGLRLILFPLPLSCQRRESRTWFSFGDQYSRLTLRRTPSNSSLDLSKAACPHFARKISRIVLHRDKNPLKISDLNGEIKNYAPAVHHHRWTQWCGKNYVCAGVSPQRRPSRAFCECRPYCRWTLSPAA